MRGGRGSVVVADAATSRRDEKEGQQQQRLSYVRLWRQDVGEVFNDRQLQGALEARFLLSFSCWWRGKSLPSPSFQASSS